MKDNFHKQLFLISEELFRIKPWDTVDNENIFGICLKNSDLLYFISIMGSSGMEYGVILMQDWKGYHALANTSTSDIDHDTMVNASHFLSLSLCRRDELPGGFAAYNKKYAVNFGKTKPFYWIAAKEPGKVFHPPKDSEAEIIYFCLNAIVELTRKNMFQPEGFIRGNEIKIFDVTRDNETVKITGRYERIKTFDASDLIFKVGEKTLSQLKLLPRLPTVYTMAAPSGLIAIRQTMPRVVIIHDDLAGVILVMQAVSEKRVKEEAFRILKEVFLGKNFLKVKGLPREIRTDSRLLYDVFKQTLASLGIRMICVEFISKIEEIVKGFHQFPPRPDDKSRISKP
ncbi:MAG: hypothetical protein Q7K98_03320 [Candidatus Omnitrophota bacterium]|nr:hypothetical protein [Candidatus Omnitrophota bacterium]